MHKISVSAMHPEFSPYVSDALHVLMVDDHPIYRAGLRKVFEGLHYISKVSESSNAEDCLYRINRTSIDLVVLDINLPDMEGIDCLKAIRKQQPHLAVLVLSPFEERHLISTYEELGAVGFLPKTCTVLELEEVLQSILKGSEFATLARYKRQSIPEVTLSRREMEVLRLLCLELSSKEIAEKLFLSKHTIDNHRKRILSKTDQRNTLALVKWALKYKYVDYQFVKIHIQRRKNQE